LARIVEADETERICPGLAPRFDAVASLGRGFLLHEFMETCSCGSSESEWRLMRSNNQITMQCLGCGTSIAIAQKGTFTPEERAQLNDFDLSLRAAGQEEKSRMWREQLEREREAAEWKRATEDLEWKRQHSEYLKTERWRQKRQKVLERCGGICEGCRSKLAEHVHHLTYQHWRNELLFELVAVCIDCHNTAHGRKIA